MMIDLSIEAIKEVQNAFKTTNFLDKKRFLSILRNHGSQLDLSSIFDEACTSTTPKISLSTFMTWIIASCQNKGDKIEEYSNGSIDLVHETNSSEFRGVFVPAFSMIDSSCFVSARSAHILVTGDRDGNIILWKPDLSDIFGMIDNEATIPGQVCHSIGKIKIPNHLKKSSSKKNRKMVCSMTSLPGTTYFIISSVDTHLNIYDTSGFLSDNFDPTVYERPSPLIATYGEIGEVALHMACGIVGKVPYIAAGGLSGTLHVAKLHPDIVMCTDATSKTRVVKHLQSLSKITITHQKCKSFNDPSSQVELFSISVWFERLINDSLKIETCIPLV